MAYLNENYLKLQSGYLFPEIARRVRGFCEQNPEASTRLIHCGIGDVTEPLPQAAVDAMKVAVEELAHRETFRGYGPEQGYEFLRSKIAQQDYRDRGIEVIDDEIFVSDGSKCDCGHILDILGAQNTIAITDPVYPIYVDTNVMAGHTGAVRPDGSCEDIIYLPCTIENDFVPEPPKEHVDLVYLCFPNNPTGSVATRRQLTRWVEYAREHDALLLFDAAYERYISDRRPLNTLLEEEEDIGRGRIGNQGGRPDASAPDEGSGTLAASSDIPHSIFEIPGANECAVEFRSFSKTGGFTGVRCGFTVMPKSVLGKTRASKKLPLHPLWHRRWSTKSNGVSYPVQRGAEALYSEEGRRQVAGLIEHYMGNARSLREAARDAGFTVHGGTHAPYIWVETRGGQSSWQTFDWMLRELLVVITPGSGFGSKGEGFFRLSAFNSRANVEEVAHRLRASS